MLPESIKPNDPLPNATVVTFDKLHTLDSHFFDKFNVQVIGAAAAPSMEVTIETLKSIAPVFNWLSQHTPSLLSSIYTRMHGVENVSDTGEPIAIDTDVTPSLEEDEFTAKALFHHAVVAELNRSNKTSTPSNLMLHILFPFATASETTIMSMMIELVSDDDSNDTLSSGVYKWNLVE